MLQNNTTGEQETMRNIKLSPYLKDIVAKCLGNDYMITQAPIIYSAILYKTGDSLRIINKVKECPSFNLDWTIYNLFRAYAKTFVTSGSIVRDEAHNSPFKCSVYPHPDIPELYKSLNPYKQTAFVLSNNASDKEVQEFFNLDMFEPIVIERINHKTRFKSVASKQNINDYLVQLPKPILLECGTITLKNYLAREENMMDAVMLTVFEGALPQPAIGLGFQIDMDKYFRLDFTSQWFEHELGRFRFYVYRKK